MPRSVLILSADSNLFGNVRAALLPDARFIDAGDAVHCDGSSAPITDIYPVRMDPDDWEDWHTETAEMPDPRTMSVRIFETRSPEWLAEVGTILARGLSAPVWFVDSGDRAWPADQIVLSQFALA